jgi:hypothetical protein
MRKYINNFPFPFCVEHKGHKNIREICFIGTVAGHLPIQMKREGYFQFPEAQSQLEVGGQA